MADVTVAPTAEPGNTPPRIRLDVTDANIPENTQVTVLRNNPDGTTVEVRTADGNPLPLVTAGAVRTGLLYDYEPPFGQSVTYTTLQDPDSVSAPITLDVDQVWLIHPGVPALSQPLTVAEFGSRLRGVPQGVFFALGRRDPIVHTDGQRKSATYGLRVLTRTVDEADALGALIDDGSTLLLTVPASRGYGITSEYVAVGDVSEDRVVRFAGNPTRAWQMECAVTARPAGGSQAERTFVDLLANYATLADVRLAYPTFTALLAGP